MADEDRHDERDERQEINVPKALDTGYPLQFISRSLSKVDQAATQSVMLVLPVIGAPEQVVHVERVACIVSDGSPADFRLYARTSAGIEPTDDSNFRDGFGPSPAGSFDMSSPLRIADDWAELIVTANGFNAGAKVTCYIQANIAPYRAFQRVAAILGMGGLG